MSASAPSFFTVSPGDVAAHMARVDMQIESLYADIVSARGNPPRENRVPSRWLASFEAWRATWMVIVDTYRSTSGLSSFPWAADSEVDQYEAQLGEWRKSFAALSPLNKPTAPGTQIISTDSMSSAVKFASVAAALLAVAWIVHEVM